MRTSPRPILASRSHPLRPPAGRRDAGLAAPDPWPSPVAFDRTCGWRSDAARRSATPRTARTGPAPTRSLRRAPEPSRSPRNAQIVRPRPPLPTERLDSRGVRRHRDPRRARSPMRSPRRPGCSDPGLHLLRTQRSTSSTPPMAMTQRRRSPGGGFVRSQRRESGVDKRQTIRRSQADPVVVRVRLDARLDTIAEARSARVCAWAGRQGGRDAQANRVLGPSSRARRGAAIPARSAAALEDRQIWTCRERGRRLSGVDTQIVVPDSVPGTVRHE